MAREKKTENKKKKRGVRFFLILLVSTAYTVILHQFHHDPLMTLATKPRSIVITSGYYPPVALASLAIAFCIMGLIFLAIQENLHGKKQTKGAWFGIAFGGMYFVGMIEVYVIYPVSLFGEMYTGLVDATGILLLSLLLGRYMADNMPEERRPANPLFPAVLIIPVIYVLLRYVSYAALHIESSYVTRPTGTFIWTAAMGVWCWIMYMLIGRYPWPRSPFRQALVFGGLVFGVNWVIFNLFALIFIQVPIVDLLYRSVVDALAVMIGTYLSALLSKKMAA